MAIYYVKNGGNNANTGLSDAQAWETIAKVNASSFNPGDQILFKKGSTWNETLVVPNSGIGGNPIIFGAYDSGTAPILSGLTTLTAWTDNGSNIWYKAIAGESKPNCVVYDGTNTPKGRWPEMPQAYLWPSNTLIPDTWSPYANLTDATLAALTDLSGVGAEVVVRSAAWIVETREITGHVGNTLTFDELGNWPNSYNGYFIQNQIQCLTADTNWCYNTANNRIYMYFADDDPTLHTIKISTIDNVISCSKDYITFDGLIIEGGNDILIDLIGSNHVTIQNCTIRLGGNIGINGYNGASLISYIEIYNNTIQDINNIAIQFLSNGGFKPASYTDITYNTIERSGYILGMGGNSNIDYSAIAIGGDYNTVEYNNIHYTGYDGITFVGIGTQVTHNYITWAVLNMGDGAAIYSFRDYNLTPTKNISYNTILHCPTQYYSGDTYEREITANAIYMDGARYCNIHHNVIGYVEGRGIFINSNEGTVVEYNTLYDCRRSLLISSQDQRSSGVRDGRARGHTVRYNKIVVRDADDYCLSLESLSPLQRADLSLYSSANNDFYGAPLNITEAVVAGSGIDYNYFGKPIDDTFYIRTHWSAYDYIDNNIYGYYIDHDLAAYVTYMSSVYDSHSVASPETIVSDVDDDELHFRYNETANSKNYTLSAEMVDVVGNHYIGGTTLQPYTGIVLIGAGTVTDDAIIPVDVTSITVTGTGGAITIVTDGGTLQMIATVLPADATNKNVTWSITPGTGTGSISSAGLLTAIADGTVTVRATAQDGTGIFDELELTFSNQVTQSVIADMLFYFPLNEPSGTTVTDLIASLTGTSTATPTIYGQDFANTGIITINATTINPSGDAATVYAHFKLDVLASTLAHDMVVFKYNYNGAPYYTMQLIVRAADNKPQFLISNQAGTVYDVIGANALSIDTWYQGCCICRGNNTKLELYINAIEVGSATADTFLGASILTTTSSFFIGCDWDGGDYPFDGLIKFVGMLDRDITVSEVSLIYTGDYPYDTGTVYVTSVTVTGAGGLSAISTNGGTLQMIATVLPTDATDKTVTWSVINGTGTATISATGLLTAITNGTVTVKAVSNDSL